MLNVNKLEIWLIKLLYAINQQVYIRKIKNKSQKKDENIENNEKKRKRWKNMRNIIDAKTFFFSLFSFFLIWKYIYYWEKLFIIIKIAEIAFKFSKLLIKI